MKKIYHGYAGLGGTTKLVEGCNITSVEIDPKIAKTNKQINPTHTVLIEDAKQYLLDHYTEYDGIILGPPCQGNTRMIRSGKNRKPRFPDLTLYELVIFLKHNFKGKWLVENVIPYYDYLIKPDYIIGRHAFWCNFEIDLNNLPDVRSPKNFIMTGTVKGSEELKNWLGMYYEGNLYYDSNHDPCQVLRNCVHPKLGKHIINCMNL